MDICDGEIYLITSPNGKNYVGQVRCYILNRKKRIYKGTNGRWMQHISEAFSNKKKQCWALNSAIKKYGANNFTVKRLMICALEKLDHYESIFIKTYNGLAPKGYNLTPGGVSTIVTDNVKKQISNTLKVYYSDPINRLNQSKRQLAITHRNDYTRKNKCSFELPKYLTYFERDGGKRIGFAVNNYKTKKRYYFSTTDPESVEYKYNEALKRLEQINGQSAAK
jgi:hypothetical protein